jgi:transposase
MRILTCPKKFLLNLQWESTTTEPSHLSLCFQDVLFIYYISLNTIIHSVICGNKHIIKAPQRMLIVSCFVKFLGELNCETNLKTVLQTRKTPRWRWYNNLDTKLSAKGGQIMKRSVYDKQFKMAAVKISQSTNKSVLEVARELGISGSSLRRWINEYDEYGESAFPGHGNALFNSTYEMKKLQKHVYLNRI